ncbi:hypothetical protein SAMN05216575_103380 [Ectopseudomonas alcaliphila]|uniref:Uncharacterized protein n=1 Tax=Ectopseudomonas alcaliphila TaxID=101564 RepID=A0A1G7EPF7_9GAMM|nr:hypothetical protein SAMN05216575_103380 [Pseudomonas alcaliphila]
MDNIEASFSKGALEISLPKRPEAVKPEKIIPVKSRSAPYGKETEEAALSSVFFQTGSTRRLSIASTGDAQTAPMILGTTSPGTMSTTKLRPGPQPKLKPAPPA